MKESAAHMLAVMTQDDEAEGWYRKADQNNSLVKAALLALEGQRLEREGKTAECAAKYAAAAKLALATARTTQLSGYNNASLDYERGFDCSGDPRLLRDAEAALETAYRHAPEDAIVVGNLTYALSINGRLRTLARQIDVRALRLQLGDVTPLLNELLDGSERTTLLAGFARDPSMRRATELLAQFEVLVPNSPRPYQLRFAEAQRTQDVDAAAAVVERARRAKALDVSETGAARERRRRGEDDAKLLARLENTRARLEAVLAPPGADRLGPKTRAAGWYLMADTLADLGLYRADKAALVQARDAAANAMRLWPALGADRLLVVALIDEAGLDGDAKAWIASRRVRHATAALDQLVADHSPLAAKLRATKQWTDVATHAKRDRARPTLSDLRLARLLGDPAFEAHARAVLDDKLTRLALELAILLDPGDEGLKQDLAYLDRR